MKITLNNFRTLVKKLIKEEFENLEQSKVLKYPSYVLDNVELEGDNIILYHYGDDEGSGYLDPDFFGKHDYTSDKNSWSKKRVFFYIDPKDKEIRVHGKEYIIKYPLKKLYPFNSDPLYFLEECQQELDMVNIPVNIQLPCISEKLEKNNFDGLIVKWQGTLRVDIWKKIDLNKHQINKEN